MDMRSFDSKGFRAATQHGIWHAADWTSNAADWTLIGHICVQHEGDGSASASNAADWSWMKG